jgi:tetratricopeptide (TPR) repeat protein
MSRSSFRTPTLFLALAFFAFGTARTSPTPDDLRRDIEYYRDLAERKNLSQNDRLYVLRRVYLKYADSGLDLLPLEKEVARLADSPGMEDRRGPASPSFPSITPVPVLGGQAGSFRVEPVPTMEDEESLVSLGAEVLSLPANAKPRELLEFLVKEKLSYKYGTIREYRAEVLARALESADAFEAPAETKHRLALALDAAKTPPAVTWSPPVPDGTGAKDRLARTLRKEAAVFREEGQTEEAVLLLVRALSLRPYDADAQEALGETLKAKLSPVEKAALLGSAPAVSESRDLDQEKKQKAQEFFREGIRLYGTGELESAAASFQESLRLDPANEWVKKSLHRTRKELHERRDPAEIWRD